MLFYYCNNLGVGKIVLSSHKLPDILKNQNYSLFYLINKMVITDNSFEILFFSMIKLSLLSID